jgi:hypothetical protein
MCVGNDAERGAGLDFGINAAGVFGTARFMLAAQSYQKDGRKRREKLKQFRLSSVKKRLELLFPNRYQLATNNDGQTYHARLEIFNPTT